MTYSTTANVEPKSREITTDIGIVQNHLLTKQEFTDYVKNGNGKLTAQRRQTKEIFMLILAMVIVRFNFKLMRLTFRQRTKLEIIQFLEMEAEQLTQKLML